MECLGSVGESCKLAAALNCIMQKWYTMVTMVYRILAFSARMQHLPVIVGYIALMVKSLLDRLTVWLGACAAVQQSEVGSCYRAVRHMIQSQVPLTLVQT